MPPKLPKPGTKTRAVYDYLMQHPGARLGEIAANAPGMSRPQAQNIIHSLRARNLIARPQKIPREFQTSDLKIAAATADIRDTIKPLREIVTAHHIHNNLIVRIARRFRTKMATNIIHANAGLSLRKLPEPYKPLPREKINAIIRENKAAVEEMLAEFRGKPAEMAVRQRVYTYLEQALARYSPELMSERHFVLLAAKRALYEHALEQARKSGFTFRSPIAGKRRQEEEAKRNAEEAGKPTATNPYAKEARAFLEEHGPRITRMVDELVRDRQARKDVMQSTSMEILVRFHPDIEYKGRFVRELVAGQAKRYFTSRNREERKARRVWREMKSEMPELQNRPKFTQHVGGSKKRFEE